MILMHVGKPDKEEIIPIGYVVEFTGNQIPGGYIDVEPLLRGYLKERGVKLLDQADDIRVDVSVDIKPYWLTEPKTATEAAIRNQVEGRIKALAKQYGKEIWEKLNEEGII